MSDITHCITQMFADDTKIFSPVGNTEDREKLQNDLDSLCVWSDKWQLRFNAIRCKVLHIGSTNQHYKYSMESIVGTVQLEETELDHEKDLGVHIDPELKFSKHVERQVNKANRILGLIRRSYEYIDMEVMKKLFTSLVWPHLEFRNVACTPRLEKDRNLIEGVQTSGHKIGTWNKRHGVWRKAEKDGFTKFKI